MSGPARWLVAILLLALPGPSTALAQSEASVQMLPNDDSGSAHCGPDTIHWSNTRSFNPAVRGSATLQATTSGGGLLLDLSQSLDPGARLIPLWCGDLLGDGSQALGYEIFSGGAHCCFSASVVLLEPGGRHLLDADLGNGGLGQPTQLDGTGPLELPASSDLFAYFDHLSFAASPFMPLVYAYDGRQYVEATRQFPDVLQADVDRAAADLAMEVARPPASQVPEPFAEQGQESIALRLYGLHVLLGDADQALPTIQAQVSPTVASWLQANAATASDALAAVYNLTD